MQVSNNYTITTIALEVPFSSAGVGRTGTFITIDIALEQVKAEGVVDIYNIVNKLRHQRPHMVQALVSYTCSCFSCLLLTVGTIHVHA